MTIIAAYVSSDQFCMYGSVESKSSDYKNSYWQSVDNKKSKASNLNIKQCDLEAEKAENTLFNIFVQLCSNGYIDAAYLSDATQIKKDYLENSYFGEKTKVLTGTIDEIFMKFLASIGNDKWPSVERLNEKCARYIPKDGVYNKPKFFRNYSFNKCMSRNNFEKIIP